jgi:hypothetical protein
MTYEELEKEIISVYKEYDFEYAYGFSSGMLYASFVCGKITKDQMDELSGLKSYLYIQKRDLQ